MSDTDARDDVRSLTPRIVEAIAEAEGVDPPELDFHLQDVIDTGAMESLMAQDGSEWHLQFTAGGHTVIVDSEGSISVDGGLST